MIKNYTGTGLDFPFAIVSSHGALWFTNFLGNSIGKITTVGKVSIFTAISIDEPEGIAAGSDGALWFVNRANDTGKASLGRITTGGVVSNYTAPSVSFPIAIAAGSDGALWFTCEGTPSIDRATTTDTPKANKPSPDSGAPGTTVTITGMNLTNATSVTYNGTPATIVSDTATRIVTEVPAGATKGHVTVTTPAGTATTTAEFTVT